MAPLPYRGHMTAVDAERFVAAATEHVRSKGYEVADCCDLFEHHDGTVVVHLKKPEREKRIGDVIVTYCDTPGTVCVMINRHTGICFIPEML